MKMNSIERELAGNYIEEYIDQLEYLLNNVGALYSIYIMDEDTEVAQIERTLNMLRMKIEKIRTAESRDDLKIQLNLKKISEDGISKGGHYGYR